MAFVDTGGWIAVNVASDSLHEAARTYYENLLSRRIRLFTSNYVLDETVAHITTSAMLPHAGFGTCMNRQKNSSW